MAILSTFFHREPAKLTRLQALISGLKIDGFRRFFFSNGLKFPEEFENRVEKFVRATSWTGKICPLIFSTSCFNVLNVSTRFPMCFFCTDFSVFKIVCDSVSFSLKFSRDPFSGGPVASRQLNPTRPWLNVITELDGICQTFIVVRKAGWREITFNVFRPIFNPDFRILREKLSRFKKKIIKIGPGTGILSTLSTLRTRVSTRLEPLIPGLKIDGFRRFFFPNGLKFPKEFENRVEKFVRATFCYGKNLPDHFFDSCFNVLNVLTRFPPCFFCTVFSFFKIVCDSVFLSLKFSRDPIFGGSRGTSTVDFCKTLTVRRHWAWWYLTNFYCGAQTRMTRDNFQRFPIDF